jgi:hypothetical protein
LFVGNAAGFCREQIRTGMKWRRYEMPSRMGQVTAGGFSTTRRMALLSGIFSPSPLSRMIVATLSNSSGTLHFNFFTNLIGLIEFSNKLN